MGYHGSIVCAAAHQFRGSRRRQSVKTPFFLVQGPLSGVIAAPVRRVGGSIPPPIRYAILFANSDYLKIGSKVWMFNSCTHLSC